MPDITMCNGDGCSIKQICYRFTATPSKYRQSYFVDSPNDGLLCDHFWDDSK